MSELTEEDFIEIEKRAVLSIKQRKSAIGGQTVTIQDTANYHLANEAVKFAEEKLQSQLLASQERVRSLLQAFSHNHVNAQDGSDTCGKCGLDLRNEIHIRGF